MRLPRDWNNTETLVLLALLIGIALGTASGYTLALDPSPFAVDNDCGGHCYTVKATRRGE